MKVAHIFWGLGFGGIETMLVNIANEQAKLGAEVHVILINDLYDESLIRLFDTAVTVHLMGRKLKSRNMWFALKMNRLLMQLRPDAIHLHGSCFYSLLWHKCLSRVASTTLHDLPTGSVRRGGLLARIFPILNLQLRGNVACIDRVPRVFAISDAVKEALWKNYGVKSTLVCNGIRTSNFLRRGDRLPDDPLRVVMVSRLEHTKKGQDLLILAAERLKGRITVDFIGDGSSSQYLQRMIDEHGLQQQVRLLGSQTQQYVAEHLRDYDLFCQPSRWEGFGLTVAEAMAAEVPVLVSEGQGPAEVTCGELYGWTFENGNVDDLVRKLTQIICNYPEAEKKAAEASLYVRRTYDVSVTAKKYLELYTTI